jgi:hypothetical protein
LPDEGNPVNQMVQPRCPRSCSRWVRATWLSCQVTWDGLGSSVMGVRIDAFPVG